MCNLEGVSVIRTTCGVRFGTHGLHDGTGAFGGIPGLDGNERLIKVGCEPCIGKRTKKMPEPTKTENGWKSNYVDIGRMGLYLLTSITAQLHHQCRVGFLSHAV